MCISQSSKKSIIYYSQKIKEKYAEGLKEIEKVIEIDPENESAKRYHESISEKLKYAEREIFKIDERNKVQLVKTKKHSEKEPSYNDLILDDDENESKRRKSKKEKSTLKNFF